MSAVGIADELTVFVLFCEIDEALPELKVVGEGSDPVGLCVVLAGSVAPTVITDCVVLLCTEEPLAPCSELSGTVTVGGMCWEHT